MKNVLLSTAAATVKGATATIGAGAWLCVAGVASAQEPNETEAKAADKAEIETVLVMGKRQGSYTIITEDTLKLVKMPGALGDPLGAITALPGVITPAAGGEPAVRGSSPSDNRYFVDGMPAGYIFHEFNTSIIDENIIQDFQLYPAGFSAQYTNATGAVFDIRLRDPVQQDFTTTLTASMLRSGVLFESALSENSAFYLSARHGMLPLFLPEEDTPDDDGIRIISAPTDSDYVSKFLWSNSEKNRLSVNFMGATDKGKAEFSELSDMVAENPDFAGEAEIQDKFDSQSVVWDYQLVSGAELHILAAHYKDEENLHWGDNYFQNIETENALLKTNVAFAVAANHIINIGAEVDNMDYAFKVRQPLFTCTEFDADCQANRRDVIDVTLPLTVKQQSLFAIDQWQATDALQLELGLQWHANDQTDQTFIHPRGSFALAVSERVTLKGSAGSYNRLPDVQYSMPELGNPKLQSYQSKHYSLGLEGNGLEGKGLKGEGLIGRALSDWNWSLEVYHKTFSELPRTLAADEPNAEDIYTNGTEGEARGIDIFINKNFSNRWYGWVALSYSESTRTNTATDQTLDYRLDTPLVLNVVGNYQLTHNWNIGFRYTAKSGEANTQIVGVKQNPNFAGHYLPVYGEPFADRLPMQSRLDFRAERPITVFGKEGVFFVDVINLLNRKNVSEIVLDHEKVKQTGELHLVKNVDMEIFPSIGMSLSF